jgi:hypothetical protein
MENLPPENAFVKKFYAYFFRRDYNIAVNMR